MRREFIEFSIRWFTSVIVFFLGFTTGLNAATYHLTFETYIIAIIASYLISFVVYYIFRKLFPKRYVVIEYEG